ncbi:MAG: TonB-dependent receptor, partial [Ignavibacteriae bacterium]|nr:TonB-dependent receptor [Ignavibacteriota bacterium]
MTNKNYNIFFLIVLLFSINLSQTYAQTGSLQGIVVDAVSNDPLPGANIILTGTSIGAASNVDGKFLIRNIPVGTYKVKATYVGYNAHEFEIELQAGRTLEAEFKLNSVGVEGETVVITAQATGQKEAINQQLSSLQIKNVVSMAKLQELPDANAAESVARLPGVSLVREGGEGAKVVIRGLSPQYNQITIDGVQLPGNVVSNDPNSQSSIVGDRGTNLSMISSSMLGGIEVIKAITPDMDAAVLGGVVNFGLRKAVKGNFDSPTYEILTQGSYNDLKSTYNDYMVVGSYEQRFFDQKFGVFVQGSTEKRNRSANELGVGYNLVDKLHGDDGIPDIGSVSLSDVFSKKERQGATLILDFDHKSGEIGFMNFFSTSDTKSIRRNESIAYSGDDIFYSADDVDNSLNVITNLLSIKQELPFYHADIKLSHTYSESKNPEDLTFQFWQDVAGFSGLGDLSKYHPQRIAELAKPDKSTARLSTIRTSENFSKDRALTAAVDLQSDFIISNFLTAKLKFGGMYQFRDRSYDFNNGLAGNVQLGGGNTVSKILQYYPDMETYGSSVVVSNFIDPDYSFGNFLNGDYSINYPINVKLMHDILELVRVGASPESFQNNKHNSVVYDYNGTEDKSAAYTMVTFNIGDLVTVVPGFRYQNLTTSYFANRGEQIPGGFQFKDTTVTRPNGYWLPMFHLRYKPLSWLQIHFAYTNTLNYPDYNAIIPRYDIGTASISYNNYLLKPATSENFDLVFSFYNNEIGLFTINGFKKRIENLIFPTKTYLTDLSGYPDLPQNRTQLFEFNTFINNPNPIDVIGLETDWQTHFWYLPEPLSGIVFSINYTHIFSEASYPRSEVIINYNDDGTFTRSILDTFYTTRLLNQPNDILNLALGFDYSGFSGRLSML